jgi:uncharacterized membrane protein YdjX (TVP38/TMEM64 family)
MKFNKSKIKYFVVVLWLVFFFISLYVYFFKGDFVASKFSGIFSASLIMGYVVYLIAGCLRGFTLIPITYFIVIGIILLPPTPLYILTMVGVMVSSTCVYYFSEYMDFDQYFESKYKRQVREAKEILSRNELPIVIVWSFMPFLPTDLICYVCGALKIDIKKFLLGVFIGEGLSCAIYIFLGKTLLGLF